MNKIISLFFIYLTLSVPTGCVPIEELKAGDAVWAQWTPGLWYHGRIEAKCEGGFKIRFDAQDEKCNPSEQVAKDITPTRLTLQPGMALLAPRGQGTYGTAEFLQKKGWNVLVRFEDGSSGEFSLQELRRPFQARR